MIREGTDGLSRGVPLQSLYEYEGNSLLPLLWRAATPSHYLLQWALQTISIPWESNSTWIYQSDYTDWSRSNLIGHNVLWCVTPGFGKQAILQGLYSWSESPTCCGHIFIIPRIMQREFGRVSKFVVFLDNILICPYPLCLLYPLFLCMCLRLIDIMNTKLIGKNNGWTYLPRIPFPHGSKRILTGCSGCRFPCDSNQLVHKCIFHMEGFTIDGQTFEPCMVLYHSKCIKVGHPFRTRHYGKDTRGVQYPPHATNFPFICELCSTRTQLGRELDPLNVKDTMLLMLERMRMIDTAHAHAVRTTNQMSNILKLVDRFFSGYGLPSIHQQLMLPVIQHPPKNLAITMFWSIALRTAIPSDRMQSNPISWNTARNQRSAISFYRTWWAKVCQPNTMYKDSDRRLLSDDNIGPTDNILSTCTARGMASRLGTESRPSFALNQRHIHWNQLARVRLLNLDLTLEERYDCVAAQCAELIFWLGWLRSKETFTLQVEDVELTSPKDYGKYGLPKGVGVILLRLLPTTKTQRDKQADMVIAWKTSSGFHLGYWMGELFSILKELKWYSPLVFFSEIRGIFLGTVIFSDIAIFIPFSLHS